MVTAVSLSAPVTTQRSPLRTHCPSEATMLTVVPAGGHGVTDADQRRAPAPCTTSPVSPARCRREAISVLISLVSLQGGGGDDGVLVSGAPPTTSAAKSANSASVVSWTRPRVGVVFEGGPLPPA